MVKYLKECERLIHEVLEGSTDKDMQILIDRVKTQIEFIQHERLIHLMVTLSFALFLLITALYTLYSSMTALISLDLMFAVLLIPYIIHYYRLENGVQKLYTLYDKLIDLIIK